MIHCSRCGRRLAIGETAFQVAWSEQLQPGQLGLMYFIFCESCRAGFVDWLQIASLERDA